MAWGAAAALCLVGGALMPLYVTDVSPELLREALTMHITDPVEREAAKARLLAAREDRQRREAAWKPKHSRITGAVRRNLVSLDTAARILAGKVHRGKLPNDLEMIAEKVFPMSAPDRRRLVDAITDQLEGRR